MKKAYKLSIAVSILLLVLVLVGLGRENVVYGSGKRLPRVKSLVLPAAAQATVDAAKTDLAERTGVTASRITMQNVEPANFPDSSLGIFEPGKRYLEAETAGYTIRFVARGVTYEYRASGDRVVFVPDEKAHDGIAQRLLRTAVSDLQDRLGVRLDEVVVQSIATVEFPDGSLGAPEPNVPYPLVVTPGYDIRLAVKGVVYRYWAADDRIVYVESFIEPTRAVTVYLHKGPSDEATEGRPGYPVQRSVPVTPEASSVVALEQLFAGPTEAERAQGYVSPFSEATHGALKSIRVEGRTAYVDLMDIRPLIPAAEGPRGREAFLIEVEMTLKEALPVEWVVYSIEGDPLTFCEWMRWCDSGRQDDYLETPWLA